MNPVRTLAVKTAVFNPAFCLTRDRSRLTRMSEQAVREAVRLVILGQADLLLVSCAYWYWEQELNAKLAIMPAEFAYRTAPIGNVLDSYDEVRRAVDILVREKYGRVIVCSDTCHGPRAVFAFKREIARRGLEIEVAEQFFVTLEFERTFEPHPVRFLAAIKSWRAGARWRWRLWNFAFGLIDRALP